MFRMVYTYTSQQDINAFGKLQSASKKKEAEITKKWVDFTKHQPAHQNIAAAHQ